ncbi:MAG: CBS domain-containing protein, partial [Pseudomonadota bacterium]
MEATQKLEKKMLSQLDDGGIIRIIDGLQPDDAVRLLRKLPPNRRGTIMARIAADRRAEIARLADYSEDVAGGLMNSRYADLSASTRCTDAVRQLSAEDDAETIYIAYIVDNQRRLIGSVELRDLLRAPKDARVADVMDRKIDSIVVDLPVEDAARQVAQSGVSALPVV